MFRSPFFVFDKNEDMMIGKTLYLWKRIITNLRSYTKPTSV